jgi:hypothetical protein
MNKKKQVKIGQIETSLLINKYLVK